MLRKDAEQRSKAEHAYYLTPAAVEVERRRQAAVNAAEYRAGARQTPHMPSWREAANSLLRPIIKRTAQLVDRFYRTLTHHFDADAVRRRYDPVYRQGQEHGDPRFRTPCGVCQPGSAV